MLMVVRIVLGLVFVLAGAGAMWAGWTLRGSRMIISPGEAWTVFSVGAVLVFVGLVTWFWDGVL